jgi:GWxTD domain-containing protein
MVFSAMGKYYVQFEIVDLNRKSKTADGAYVDHSRINGEQDFMLRDQFARPVFDNHINPGQQCYLYTLTCKDPRLFISLYRQEYPIALAPFVETRSKSIIFNADTSYFIEMDMGVSRFLNLPEKGIYWIQSDTSLQTGFAIFRFHKDFPDVVTPDQMRFPLRYICSRNEFNDLMMMKNAKEAIDEFWLKRSDNADRAKELIRKFYTRVRYANQYFTSYHEGWKTDRGMLYIIFGPPSLVYRNPNSETWIYGEDRNFLSITYEFRKSDNPFTDNDYILERSQEYKEPWYDAVEAWRQ